MNDITNDKKKLNSLNQNILYLERSINQLDEVKLLKHEIQAKNDLESKIIKLSTYDINEIGPILAKLMSKYEGVEYRFEKNPLANDIFISPNHRQSFPYVYPTYYFDIIESNDPEQSIYHNIEKEMISKCCLLPSFYINDKSRKNVFYVQNFIDYLYQNRNHNAIYCIDENYLSQILTTFIEITKKDQLIRKEKINNKILEIEEERKRKNFEKSCLIDRKLIYNCIVYIVNHYEEGMIAVQIKEKEQKYFSQWTTLYGVHKLIIEDNKRKIEYKCIVDEDGCYPDEEYCGMHVDINKDSDIYFFDLKDRLSSIINSSIYLKDFMKMIEHHYCSNNNVSNDNLQKFLVKISNNKKERQLIKRKH